MPENSSLPIWKIIFHSKSSSMERSSHVPSPHFHKKTIPFLTIFGYVQNNNTICKELAKLIACCISPKRCGG